MNQPMNQPTNTQKLADYIQQNADRINEEAPQDWSPSRVQRLALHLQQEDDENLHRATPASLVQCILRAAHMDLDIELGEAHLIARKQKGADGSSWYEADLMADYKGLVKLAQRAPGVIDVHARIARDGDVIEYEQTADGVHFRHEPDVFSTADPIGVYCLIEKEQGQPRIEFMNLEQIAAVRAKAYEHSKPWEEFWGEMAKKSVIRRTLKMVDLDPEARKLVKHTDQMEYDFDRGGRRQVESDRPKRGVGALIQGTGRQERPDPEPRQIAADEQTNALDRLFQEVRDVAGQDDAERLVDILRETAGDGSVEAIPKDAITDRLHRLQDVDDAQRAELVRGWTEGGQG